MATIQDQWRLLRDFQCRVDACEQPLSGRLFVSGRAVDLAGEVQTFNSLGLERCMQLRRRSEVVLDRVTVAHDLSSFETEDRVNQLFLHIAWQASRDAVAVVLAGVPTFRLQKDVMRCLVGEPHDFVFDAWTIPRSSRLDLSRIHWRAMQVGADEFVNSFIRLGEMADHLRLSDRVGQKRKRLRLDIARLCFEHREINRASIQPTWCPRLEASQFKAEFGQRVRQPGGRSFAGSAAGRFRLAGVHDRLQKRACRDDDRLRAIHRTTSDTNAGHEKLITAIGHRLTAIGRTFQAFHGFLPQREVFLLLDAPFHRELVGLFVGLSSRAVHRRAFGLIEHPKLDAGLVDHPPHFAAECVDFADNLPLRDAADCGIATHRRDHVTAHRQQRGLRAEASRRQCRFTASVTGSDHHYIKIVDHITHRLLSRLGTWSRIIQT